MVQSENLAAWARIRESRGISLEQIADATKISLRSLRAIEAGDFGKLPGGVYNTSYIRQYCRAIEFDEDALLAVYYRASGIESEKPENGSSRPRQQGFQTLSASSGS
jgi:cytoskeletal protein RodZ